MLALALQGSILTRKRQGFHLKWFVIHWLCERKLNIYSTSFFSNLGALLACRGILKSKNIKVVGIDYDEQYIQQANLAIQQDTAQDLLGSVRVAHMSVYDVELRWKELCLSGIDFQEFDAIYFSGSFSLLPDWTGALMCVSKLLRSGGKIYISQTYQKQSSWILSWLKPWLRFLTTIDFGQLVLVDRITLFYKDLASKNVGWKLLHHGILPNNVNNSWQAAYLTILQVNEWPSGPLQRQIHWTQFRFCTTLLVALLSNLAIDITTVLGTYSNTKSAFEIHQVLRIVAENSWHREKRQRSHWIPAKCCHVFTQKMREEVH